MDSFHSTTYQIVWATKYRRKTMDKSNRRRLYLYLHNILLKYECYVLRINGVSDHLHIILSIPPKVCISKLVKELKQDSSKWVRVNYIFPTWTGWQRGFFVASYAFEARKNLVEYVKRQEAHHGETSLPAKETWREELIRLLDEFGIPWEEAFLD